jgi:hypothetical protein
VQAALRQATHYSKTCWQFIKIVADERKKISIKLLLRGKSAKRIRNPIKKPPLLGGFFSWLASET